jgi:hypothetical protein
MATEPAAGGPTGGQTSANRGTWLGRVGDFLRIPLLPLLFLARLLIIRVSTREGMQSAMFMSFPCLVYVWPLCVMSWAAWFILTISPGAAGYLGWLWLMVMLFGYVVIGADIGRNSALAWALFLALLFAVGGLIHANYKIPVLGFLYEFFVSMNVQLDKGLAVAAAVWLTLLLIIATVMALIDGRHEISSRELTHRRFLRVSENWPLAMNRVRLEWPDMLEMIVLFGAGHVVIIDHERREVLRIPNVPCLWFFREEVENILDVMATTEVASTSLRNPQG